MNHETTILDVKPAVGFTLPSTSPVITGEEAGGRMQRQPCYTATCGNCAVACIEDCAAESTRAAGIVSLKS